jgi:hypothetical protein
MSRMHNPPHPGEVVKELSLDPLKLTVTAAAEGLGVSRRTLSALLNGHAGISPTWPSGCPRHSGVRRKAGCNCDCNMISGKPSNDPARSRSSISRRRPLADAVRERALPGGRNAAWFGALYAPSARP